MNYYIRVGTVAGPHPYLIPMEELFNPAWVDAQVARSIDLWNDCALQPYSNCTSIRPQFTPQEQQRREDA
jgi:hypothetical protein